MHFNNYFTAVFIKYSSTDENFKKLIAREWHKLIFKFNILVLYLLYWEKNLCIVSQYSYFCFDIFNTCILLLIKYCTISW
jgi:hypothetical protein